MKTWRGLLFATASAAAFASGSNALSQPENCLDPEVVIDPDISKLPDGQSFLESMKTEYGAVHLREVRYDFVENNNIVRIKEQFVLDFSEIIRGINNDGFRRTKEKENCNTVLVPKDFSLTPDAGGDLRGGFSIDTTFRACQIFQVPCVEDWYKITMCDVEWKEDIDDHVFGVNISLERAFYTKAEKSAAIASAQEQLKDRLESLMKIEDPLVRELAKADWQQSVDKLSGELICKNPTIRGRKRGSVAADEVSLCGASQFDERGYSMHGTVKNLLLNIIGIATLNIGSKFILDNYRSKLSDTHASIDKAFSANLPGRAAIVGGSGMAEVFMGSMKMNQVQTAFGQRVTSVLNYIAFFHVSEHPEDQGIKRRTFCDQVRPVIAQYGALLRSTVTGDQEVAVDGQTSLWKLARSAYGSGYYYVTLLRPNDIAFRKANALKLGQRLSVPAMYKIWTGEERLVRIGDSLWRIAKAELGAGFAYGNIVRENAKFLDRRGRLYPVQLLQMAR